MNRIKNENTIKKKRNTMFATRVLRRLFFFFFMAEVEKRSDQNMNNW